MDIRVVIMENFLLFLLILIIHGCFIQKVQHRVLTSDVALSVLLLIYFIVACVLPSLLLFFQETGLKHNTATVNLAINLFGVLGQADTLYFGTSFDNH